MRNYSRQRIEPCNKNTPFKMGRYPWAGVQSDEGSWIQYSAEGIEIRRGYKFWEKIRWSLCSTGACRTGDRDRRLERRRWIISTLDISSFVNNCFLAGRNYVNECSLARRNYAKTSMEWRGSAYRAWRNWKINILAACVKQWCKAWITWRFGRRANMERNCADN